MSKLEISEQVVLAKGSVLSLPLLPDVNLPPYFKALVCFHHVPISVSELLAVSAFKSTFVQARYAFKAPLVFAESFLSYSER